MDRPSDLYDRKQEWEDLSAFICGSGHGLKIGVVSGRRRQGKSYLLRRAATAATGLYHQAQQLGRAQSLARFSADVAQGLGLPSGAVSFADWDVALRTALGLPPRGHANPGAGAAGSRRLVVIDELPYLLEHSPELPSVLQELFDESQNNPRYPAACVIVCGSALSVMSEMLGGGKPLRARAALDMTLKGFDYRDAAGYWQVGDPEIAFWLDAVFGGTPGYRSLVEASPPTSTKEMPSWLGTSVMNPSHALFSETDYLLREDPRIRDRQIYHSILAAVAGGRRTQTAIGAAVERNHNQLRYPLENLVKSGFLIAERDMLTSRQPLYSLADPIVRFEELITSPSRALLEERDVGAVWEQSQETFSSGVLGPHFERICAVWTQRYSAGLFGSDLGEVGPAVINDRAGRSQHQLDVVGLQRGRSTSKKPLRVLVLGEAKASNQHRTVADLDRLEHIKDLLVNRGVPAESAHLTLFGRNGFDTNLKQAATRRPEVHLITLGDLYGHV